MLLRFNCKIWESDGPATLHFTKNDIPESPPSASDGGSGGGQNKFMKHILGAVVEDEPLVSCVWDELRQASNVDLISPATVTNILQPSSPSSSDSNSPIELTYRRTHKNVDKNDKTTDSSAADTITTDLLVAADGANSQIRRDIGTFPTVAIAYGRSVGRRHPSASFSPYPPSSLVPHHLLSRPGCRWMSCCHRRSRRRRFDSSRWYRSDEVLH